MGVYVNDLNLHDSSRELILAGTQQSAELQLALDQVSGPHPDARSSKPRRPHIKAEPELGGSGRRPPRGISADADALLLFLLPGATKIRSAAGNHQKAGRGEEEGRLSAVRHDP